MTHPLPNGERTVELNGVRIRYRIAGRGPVLVMQAPGWGIGASPYEGSMAPLEKEFTVVYYDPRASGASTAPVDAAHLGVHANVADLEALREHLGLETFALMGHSHGGLIALHYAMRYPERVTHVVSLDGQLIGVHAHGNAPELAHAVLMTDPIFASTWRWFTSVGCFGRIEELRTDEEFATFLRRVAPIYFRRGEAAQALAAAIPKELPLRTVREVSAKDGAFPIDARVEQLGGKLLLVSGLYDAVCPHACAEALHARVPGSKLAAFHESGHFPWIEERERFFEVVPRFLRMPTAEPALRARA